MQLQIFTIYQVVSSEILVTGIPVGFDLRGAFDGAGAFR